MEGKMKLLFLLLSFSAICIILYALYLVMDLRKKILIGGEVKATWKRLSWMIVLFASGYLTTPLFPYLPEYAKDVVVGIIFLFGAIFVVIVIKLFHKIYTELAF
jgi:hypothetical protein